MTRRRVVVVLLVLAGIALAIQIAIGQIDVSAQKALVESRLSEAFGLEVRIEGEFELAAFPRPRLRVTELRVANLPGSPSPHLLEVGELSFGFELFPLFSGLLELERVSVRDVTVHIEPDAAGRIDLEHHLPSLAELPEPETDARLRVELDSLEVSELRVFYRDPASGDVHAAVLERFTLESPDPGEPLSLHLRGSAEGGSFDLSGRLGPLAQLLEGKEPYPVRIAGRIFEARLQIDGRIGNPTELSGVDLTIDVALPELANLAAYWADELPDLGPASFHGRLHDDGGVLGVDGLRLAAQGGSIRGELTGAIQDLREFRGVDLELELVADDLRRLGALAGHRAPPGSRGRLRATLSDRGQPLSIDGECELRTSDGSIVLEARGRHVDLSRIEGVDLALQLTARDLSILGETLGIAAPLPAIGPIAASGRLHARSGALGLEEIAVEIGRPEEIHARVQGSVRQLRELRGIQLRAKVGVPDTQQLAPYLKRDLPPLGALSGSVEFSDSDGTLGIESVEVHARGGAFSLELSGAFDDLREIDEIDVSAELRADDLAALGRLFDVSLPPIGPVEFSGRVKGDDEELTASGRVRIDRTEVSGRGLARFADGRPYIEATLHSPHVHLDDLGIHPETDTSEVRSRATARAREADPLEQLRAVDLELALKLDRVSGEAGLDVRDAELRVTLRDGELRLYLTDSPGTALVALLVDARTPEPSFKLKASANGIDIAKLAAQVNADTESAGNLQARIELRSTGATWDAVRAGLEGQIWIRIHDWAVAGRASREFMRSMRLAFLPSSKPPPLQTFGCFVAEAKVEAGVAKLEKLIFDGGNAIVTGSGTVDLARDTLDLRLVPTVRDPALLSISPTVDVSGPLADPVFKPVHRTLATSAARALISGALKPAGALLRPLTRQEEKDPVACEEPPPSVTARSMDYLRSFGGTAIRFGR